MRRVTISIPDQLFDAVVAQADERPVSAVVRRAIAAWLEDAKPVAVRPKPRDPRVTQRVELHT